MSRAESAWRSGAEQHVVQFYGEDDRLLVHNVASFLQEGLSAGDGVVAIARQEHLHELARRLRDDPIYQAAVGQSRLLLLDAEITLARFMVAGEPDWDRFEQVVGGVLRELRARSRSSRLRAYGEMVGLLWEAGRSAAAVRLEEYWNRLLRSTRCSLYCGYPIDVFADEFRRATIEPILAQHTHLVPGHPRLGAALEQACEEVLGPAGRDLAAPPPGETTEPESMVVWLKDQLPEQAREILERAERFYHAR